VSQKAGITPAIGQSVFPTTIDYIKNLPPGNYIAWASGNVTGQGSTDNFYVDCT
jgi:hypothetical protein